MIKPYEAVWDRGKTAQRFRGKYFRPFFNTQPLINPSLLNHPMSGVIGSKRGFRTRTLEVMKVAGPMGKKCLIMIVSKMLMRYSSP